MRQNRLIVRGALVALLCLMVSSCAGTGGNDDEQPSPVPTGPPIAKKTPASELSDDERDFPELPQGAGAIDEDAPKKITRTASGLGYRILRKSDGRKPKATETVVAHYKGWLDDGTQFDSSYDGGKPISFSLSGVIAGWTEGLQHVGIGGMIELDIPSELGYGQRRQGKIPPGARLHFLVELKDIK